MTVTAVASPSNNWARVCLFHTGHLGRRMWPLHASPLPGWLADCCHVLPVPLHPCADTETLIYPGQHHVLSCPLELSPGRLH